MTNILVNRATKDDAGLLYNIRRKAILAQPESFWDATIIKRAAEAFDEEYLRQEIISGQEFHIFNNLTSSLGFVSWRSDYLAYLFVSPEGQNIGLGSKMLKFAEDHMKTAGQKISWLWAHPYSENFYARHSYNKVDETYSPFGVPLNKWLKELK